jgi:hypothetical protein
METKIKPSVFVLAALLGLLFAGAAAAQDVQTGVVYICNGERMLVESCNIRDLSDNASCMVQHPDRPLHNGFVAYTNETRGSLKKLIPTCKQPSAQELAKVQAFQKKQQDTQNAIEKKNVAAMDAPPPPPPSAGPPKSAQMQSDQLALRRCVSSGRVPAVCMGNTLSKGFGDLLGKMLPSVAGPIPPGPNMSGAFAGSGSWRIEFDERSAMMNCAGLAPEQRSYSIVFKNNEAVVTIESTPKPVVLILKTDGTLVSAGPMVVDGSIITGYTNGGGADGGHPGGMTTQTTTQTMTPMEAEAYQRGGGGGTLTQDGQTYTLSQTTNSYTPSTQSYDPGPQPIYKAATRTCSQAILSSKGAGPGALDAAKSLATALFNDGDSGPKVPAGLGMHGVYAGPTGFSVEFYPESAVIGCGPEAARAYPYVVQPTGVKINAPDHSIALAFKPDGTLAGDPGPYVVQGRRITGQNDDGDFTFVPLNATCNVGVLSPGATPGPVPTTASVAPAPAAAASRGPVAPPAAPARPAVPVAMSGAPTGNAVLSIISGFAAQPNVPNPLAGRSYILLRDSLTNALIKGGVPVAAGSTPFKAMNAACATEQGCQQVMAAVNSDSASLIKADANGNANFPGVPAGTYFLMISAKFSNQTIFWGQQVDLKAGANSITLDQRNSTPVN